MLTWKHLECERTLTLILTRTLRWEWPAYKPVRVTSQHEYDLPSCAACAAWLAHETLGPRWAQMTITAAEHLESGVPAPRLFGSGTGLLVECPSTGPLPIYTLPHSTA